MNDLDISKLTVAKLKCLCREKGLTNYSKLTKHALLEKLGLAGLTATGGALPHKKLLSTDSRVTPISGCKASTNGLNNPVSASSPTHGSTSSADIQPTTFLEKSDTPGPPQTQKISNINAKVATLHSHFVNTPVKSFDFSVSAGSKRSLDLVSPTSSVRGLQQAPKRLKNMRTNQVLGTNAMLGLRPPDAATLSLPVSTMAICDTRLPELNPPMQPYHSPIADSDQKYLLRGPPASRTLNIEPMAPCNNSQQSTNQPSSELVSDHKTITTAVIPQSSAHSNAPSLSSGVQGRPRDEIAIPTRLRRPPIRQDASIPPPPEVFILSSLNIINIPPLLSQWKRLHLMSLALSWLDDGSRSTCITVSRLFRYAVYTSALDILKRWFSGERFSRLIHTLLERGDSLEMVNLWPYLRLRREEIFQREKEYKRSWVPRFFQNLGFNIGIPISKRLLTSPDVLEQFSVSFRFIQTRICFALSCLILGNTSLRWVMSKVVDAQQVLENEIWRITVASIDTRNDSICEEAMFYVLYETCEVIGRPPATVTAALSGPGLSSRTLRPDQSGTSYTYLRADWSSHIDLNPLQRPRVSLIEQIHSANTDDFERGIARGWLKRIQHEGKEGELKRKVAEKYILGCVVGNSVSGEYRSTAQMALEFAGIPGGREARPLCDDKIPSVNMFLPERHNVESVYLTTSGGLHPALAVVQTVGRQEGTFVLRENGVVIGEDERVPEMWMTILGCSESGMIMRN